MRNNVNGLRKEIKVTLKDGTNLVLAAFGRSEKDIRVPMSSEVWGVEKEVEVPHYMYNGRSNYGFDRETGILAKRCTTCGNWFAIAKLASDGTWDDIYSEAEVHFDGTKIRSDCNACYLSRNPRIEKNSLEKTKLSKKSLSVKKNSNSGLKKVSIHISAEDYQFIRLLKVIDCVSIADVFSEMITKERKERNIKF